jgi:hypothetical protein
MKPKEEATEGTVLSPEDSEAINDALSFLRKAMVKIYESALDHKIALPWQVEATDGDGDVIARLSFVSTRDNPIKCVRKETPANVKGKAFTFPLTVTLTGRKRRAVQLKIKEPSPDLPEPKFLN